jgi:hypothetical protein
VAVLLAALRVQMGLEGQAVLILFFRPSPPQVEAAAVLSGQVLQVLMVALAAAHLVLFHPQQLFLADQEILHLQAHLKETMAEVVGMSRGHIYSLEAAEERLLLGKITKRHQMVVMEALELPLQFLGHLLLMAAVVGVVSISAKLLALEVLVEVVLVV